MLEIAAVEPLEDRSVRMTLSDGTVVVRDLGADRPRGGGRREGRLAGAGRLDGTRVVPAQAFLGVFGQQVADGKTTLLGPGRESLGPTIDTSAPPACKNR